MGNPADRYMAISFGFAVHRIKIISRKTVVKFMGVMKKHIYVAGYAGEAMRCMLRDLEGDNITFVDGVLDSCGQSQRVWKILRHIPYSEPLLWPFYTLSRIPYERDAENYILMINSLFSCGFTYKYLRWLKRRIPNVRFVLYILDPYDVFFPRWCHKDMLTLWDRVYNINYEDSTRLQQQYWPLVYSEKHDYVFEHADEAEKCVLYFCGGGADRDVVLRQVYVSAEKSGVSTNFVVLDYEQHDEIPGIRKINVPMPYSENIYNIMNCNCILEIVHEGYTNPTQRYSEAVCFGKKLLTNNVAIVNFPCYNSQYMHIFHDVSEIDWGWLCQQEYVDYGYQGEFSPERLVEDMIHALSGGG